MKDTPSVCFVFSLCDSFVAHLETAKNLPFCLATSSSFTEVVLEGFLFGGVYQVCMQCPHSPDTVQTHCHSSDWIWVLCMSAHATVTASGSLTIAVTLQPQSSTPEPDPCQAAKKCITWARSLAHINEVQQLYKFVPMHVNAL